MPGLELHLANGDERIEADPLARSEVELDDFRKGLVPVTTLARIGIVTSDEMPA